MLNFNFLTPEILILAQEEGAKSSLQSLIIIPIMLVAILSCDSSKQKRREKRKEMITNLQKGTT